MGADSLLGMAQAITLRLSDLDAEDMRRRCDAHERFLTRRPDVAAFSADWADNNLTDLPG